MGSGIIISKDGYIVTNAHVAADTNGQYYDLTVSLGENDERKAKIIGVDKKTDLAVLKIDADNLTPVELGDSDQVKIGQSVFVIGNPLGLEKSMTKGIISGLNRPTHTPDFGGLNKYIQTDAAVNPGNSGGALFDAHGRVIGLINSKSTNEGVDNVGFAIPTKTVKEVIADLINHGRVTGRPALGATVLTVPAYLAQKLDIQMGVVIQSFMQNSTLPAKGVREKDIITKVDGKNITSVSALHAALQGHKVGDAVTLTIFRMASRANTFGENQTFEVTVTLVEETN
jgi:serine protease Do